MICVERSWDRQTGPIAPKSRAGVRRVPMSMLVRRELREAQLRSGRRGDELVFGRTPEVAFAPQTLHRRTKMAWHEGGLTAQWAADGMLPPGLHDARHHCLTHWGRVSDVGRLHQASGHSDIRQTQRYLHVPPDRDAEDAARLDVYLGVVRSLTSRLTTCRLVRSRRASSSVRGSGRAVPRSIVGE